MNTGKDPVPGTIVKQWEIPPREYLALEMTRGQVLRIVDLDGQQVADVVCFNRHDLGERLNNGNSMLLNRAWLFRPGHVLYSDDCAKMLTLLADTAEMNFTYGPKCSEELNHLRYGVHGTRNCRDNLALALAPYGISKRDIPWAYCPFMKVVAYPDGRLDIEPPPTKPGDYTDLRAEMDLLVAISNCPQERNPCNNFNPTRLGVVLYDPTSRG